MVYYGICQHHVIQTIKNQNSTVKHNIVKGLSSYFIGFNILEVIRSISNITLISNNHVFFIIKLEYSPDRIDRPIR